MLIMAIFLAVAGIFDHLLHRIPNVLTGIMLVACACYNLAVTGPLSLIPMMARIIISGMLFFPVFSIGALGAGDVKLIAVCAGFLDFSRGLFFVFISLFLAALMGILKMAMRKEITKRMLTLKKYVSNVLKTGMLQRYHCNKTAEKESGVALAGAMFVSALIGIGGFY